MKVFVENWNGILDGVIDSLRESGELTDNYHNADAFLLWQDVRGDCNRLAQIIKHSLKKPLVVMQHGRGAMRDYAAPNKFPLLADKVLVWGDSEKQTLTDVGISPARIDVVGCPLFKRLVPKDPERRGKNILFVPVIAERETPENLLVHATLKKWESDKMIETLYKYFDKLKTSWAWEHHDLKEVTLPDGTVEKRIWRKEIKRSLPRWITYEAGLVNVKLTDVHDASQYQSPQIVSKQNDPNLIDDLAELLANIDVMVCLEEGTMQLLACAMGIPVIVVDIFKYGTYGGVKDYDSIKKIVTPSVYRITRLNKVGSMIDHALSNLHELDCHRERICEVEGGSKLGDPDTNAINIIRKLAELPQREAVSV